MFTYQTQDRAFEVQPGEQLVFPNDVKLELELFPRTAFGTGHTPSRSMVKAREAKLTIDQDTGRWVGQSDPPLEPLEHTPDDDTDSPQVWLSGNAVIYKFRCESIDELQMVMPAFKWVLPVLLNLTFMEPPYAGPIKGLVGETAFTWRMKRTELKINLYPRSKDELEDGFRDSVKMFDLFSGGENRRLLAALSYFQRAVRLDVVGNSPWEFMPEILLNYAKCLDVLFVCTKNSKDDVRDALKKLKYDDDAIEGDFIPLMILRSFVDVAHPRIKMDELRHRNVLFNYLSYAEKNIRDLLSRVIAALQNGNYQLPPQPDINLSNKDKKGMDRLIQTMGSRFTLPGTAR